MCAASQWLIGLAVKQYHQTRNAMGKGSRALACVGRLTGQCYGVILQAELQLDAQKWQPSV